MWLYGRWILDNGRLPTADPFWPLVEGVPIVDTAWLSQVILATIDTVGGIHWLAFTFAAVGLASFMMLSRAFFLLTRDSLVCLVATLLVLIVGWSRIGTIRPESFAMCCFAGLLWLIISNRANSSRLGLSSARLWIGVALTMMLWANLHGSFVCGLAILGCCLLDAVIEAAIKTRSLWKVITNADVGRWLIACELALAATLLNPHGIDLLLHVAWFSDNQNLQDILEWQPLVVMDVGGREFALSWVLLAVVWRYSRTPIRAADALMLALFSVASVMGIRMLTWYAPIFGIVIAPHLGELKKKLFPSRQAAKNTETDTLSAPGRPSWVWSLTALLAIWTAFSLTDVSQTLLGGTVRQPVQVLDRTTPIKLANYLRENPPQGQVFHSQAWADWLLHRGSAELQPFMTMNGHQAPHRLWQDYRRIESGSPGWNRLLSRYRVTTVIIDRKRQEALASGVAASPAWKLQYEDDQAQVYRHVPRSAKDE